MHVPKLPFFRLTYVRFEHAALKLVWKSRINKNFSPRPKMKGAVKINKKDCQGQIIIDQNR